MTGQRIDPEMTIPHVPIPSTPKGNCLGSDLSERDLAGAAILSKRFSVELWLGTKSEPKIAQVYFPISLPNLLNVH
jgi:hypothetical protein